MYQTVNQIYKLLTGKKAHVSRLMSHVDRWSKAYIHACVGGCCMLCCCAAVRVCPGWPCFAPAWCCGALLAIDVLLRGATDSCKENVCNYVVYSTTFLTHGSTRLCSTVYSLFYLPVLTSTAVSKDDANCGNCCASFVEGLPPVLGRAVW